MIHFDAKHQKSEAQNEGKISEKLSKKIEVKQKLSEKSEKKQKERKNRLELSFALFRFEAKLLNRSEAKNLKQKK
jgi:hypothetical protein